VARRASLTDLRRTEEDVMAQPRPARTHVGIWIAITVVLAASLVATLWVPFYNHLTPMLGGFPFFYWYQLIWVPIVAILSAVAYLLSKVARRDSEAPSAQAPGPGRGEAS
jgi:magnesium-transporting ATPase (P-type)